jgi:hypothetical protein
VHQDFERAQQRCENHRMSGVTVEVAARAFAVPFECPCCGAVPDAETRVPVKRAGGQREVARDSAPALAFPYCQRCIGHVAEWESAGVMSAGVLLLGMLAAVGIALLVNWLLGVIALIAAALLAYSLAQARRGRARASCGPSCASPEKALAYLGWSGTTSAFTFDSPTYTARFAEQNTRDLVNISPHLRKLLEGHKLARLAVPTPASPVTVASEPPGVRDWIAKIEGAAGVVARRNTLQRALDGLHEAADRTLVLEAVTKLELAEVLGRVAGLASHDAKQRALHKAIGEIRADNIPTELQDAEVKELERRLADL